MIEQTQKMKNIHSKQQKPDNEEDFQYYCRNEDQSIKYFFTLHGKTMKILDENSSKESIRNMPIICSYADMQFKFSPQIQQQFIRLIDKTPISLGYTRMTNYQTGILLQRLRRNIYPNISQQSLFTINSMLTLYYAIIKQLLKQQDKVLIFTPTYFRFIFTLKTQQRPIVEYQLKTRDTQNGIQYYIDFQQLEKLFQQNEIKLMLWVNPHNPTCRIWKFDEMEKLNQLILKYKCLVFSDDIFCQSIEDMKQYTSLLKFQRIHQNLIWASSFGKAFNCSGNSFSYAIIPNKEIRNKLQDYKNRAAVFPKYTDKKLMQCCYTVGQNWRINCIKYVQKNYIFLKQQIVKRELKILVSTLDSGFLPNLDFCRYGLTYAQLHKLFQQQNIFPTYLDTCFINNPIQNISTVRINLALNRDILIELINRLQKALKNS